MSERMNPAVKAEWLTALRSGKYAQGKGSLSRESGTYCCLGVLCDLAVKSGLSIEVKADDEGDIRYNRESSYLPEVVREWAWLRDGNPLVTDVDLDDCDFEDVGHMCLANRNDDGSSFAEIADLIEEHL